MGNGAGELHPAARRDLAVGDSPRNLNSYRISNVPFGDYTVHDPRWNDFKFPIHDYFFAAALDKVRPGGLLMFVTSHRRPIEALVRSLTRTDGGH